MNIEQRRGVATVVLVILVVILIGVAAVAYYAVSSSPSKSSTTSSSSSKASSSSSHSSSSASQTASSSSTSSQSTETSSSASQTASSSSSSSSSTILLTSSSTSSASSTTSPASTTQTLTSTCTSTETTSTSTINETPEYIGLIATYSSIGFTITETINGTSTQNATIGYQVISSSGGIYTVNMSLVSSSTAAVAVAKVDSNNDTVLSFTADGFTETGSEAASLFNDYMGFFGLEAYYDSEITTFTSSSYFTSQGTSTQTFGTTSFAVTTYVANNTPETVNYCGGSVTFTKYELQVGTPPGTKLLFITYLNLVETAPENLVVTFQLTSMVVG